MLNHETNELLRQEITDEELHELLQRLGQIEFDWSPKTTVADVVEATSSDPVAVGRLLAEIRKEDWEERFGLRLDDHESRLQETEVEVRKYRRRMSAAESRLDSVEARQRKSAVAASPSSNVANAQSLEELINTRIEHKRRQKSREAFIVMIVGMVVMFIVCVLIPLVWSELLPRWRVPEHPYQKKIANPYQSPLDALKPGSSDLRK